MAVYPAPSGNPTNARWHVPDPLAHEFAPFSPYSYCLGNPVNYIDPDGREVKPDGRGGYDFDGEDALEVSALLRDGFSMAYINILASSFLSGATGYTSFVDYSLSLINPGCNIEAIRFVGSYKTKEAPSGQGDESWISKAWNSAIARYIIPDVVYVNGSGVGTYLGGGGLDLGLALPLRGKSAGTVYLFFTFKGKIGLHGGVSVNLGRSNYLGPVNKFDFNNSFGGKSSGGEGDYLVGASITISEEDQYGNSLISIDVGAGPGIGGSVNIRAITYTFPLYRIW